MFANSFVATLLRPKQIHKKGKTMESKTKNKKTRAQIEDMAKRAFNGLGLAAGDDAIIELKEGWFNAAYSIRLADGREVVLKIAPPRWADGSAYVTIELYCGPVCGVGGTARLELGQDGWEVVGEEGAGFTA